MMCRWSSQITSDCAGYFLNPSRLPSPPPPPSAPPLSHTLVLITISFVTPHMVIQGCFKTTSFDTNYWHKFLQLTHFALLPGFALSRTFFATFLGPKKMHTLFLPDNDPGNFFSRSFLCYNFSFFLMSHANYLF